MEQRFTEDKPNTALIQQLVYSASHDLSAHLRHVTQFSSLLSEEAGSRLEQKEQRWLGLIHDCGKQAQDMLEAFVKLARLSKNKRKEFLPKQLLDSVLKSFNGQVNSQFLRLEIEEHWANVFRNEEHWRVMFYNLIENALLFHPRQPTEPPRIHISCKKDNEHIVLTVDDNGIGVPTDKCADLTRPFFQIHGQEHYPGLGMGLTYCAYVAELNGGNLHFEESPLGGLRATYAEPLCGN